MYYIQTYGIPTLRNQLAGITPWPAMPGSDDPHADSTILQSVQGDGYLIRRAQEVLLQGNPSVEGSNALQHAAMLLAPLTPAPVGPTSPRPAPPEDSGSALIRAQREEYRAAENADRQRQQQQQQQSTPNNPDIAGAPDSTDSDALRAAARAQRREQVIAQTRTQEQIEAEMAEVGDRIWAEVVAQREQQRQATSRGQQRQQPDVEQVRRARNERFARAHPSPESRRRQPQQQARPVSVSLSRPDYGRMSSRELNRLAYRRFGPGYREECESRGSRRRALIDLLESCH